jgi:hypothetical protein
VVPLAIGTLVCGFATLGLVLFTERGRLLKASPTANEDIPSPAAEAKSTREKPLTFAGKVRFDGNKSLF